MAAPPAGSGLKPVMGDRGLPVLGHIIEMFRGGPDFPLHLYKTRGPVFYAESPALPSIVAIGPDATQAIFSNRNKDYSQKGWHPVIGPFFNRGLMMLDFDEHMHHRRIMQEAFTRSRLTGYVDHIDQVATAWWPTTRPTTPRFLFHPAMKELTLDIASVVFMGHEPGTDHDLVTKVNQAFTTTTRAGGAIIRTSVPPFKWWRGCRPARSSRTTSPIGSRNVAKRRARHADGAVPHRGRGRQQLQRRGHRQPHDLLDDGRPRHLHVDDHDNGLQPGRQPRWQERCRDESDRLGDGPLDIEALEKLESLDLVMDESLRLVTPLPFNMRQTVRDTDLLGYYVPAGTNVVTWPGTNHWLPELWTDPLKFDPARFTEPRSEHKQHRYAFAPFGGGAHKCIGMVFGRLEVKTVMHRLLRRYRLELSRPSYPAALGTMGACRSRWMACRSCCDASNGCPCTGDSRTR